MSLTPPETLLTPPELKVQSENWGHLFRTWQALHWTTMIFIAGGSAMVASRYASDTGWHDGMAVGVAIASAIYAVLQPASRAASYRRAWSEIKFEIMRNEGVPQNLIDAAKRAEGFLAEDGGTQKKAKKVKAKISN
jgi:hypothetical protein